MSREAIDPVKLQELTEVFRRYGAPDPEAWARSQMEEGIPQLAIFSFARAMWAGVADEEDDPQWIEEQIAWSQQRPRDPCAQIGPALAEMLARGVSRRAIIDLVRVVQFEALYHVASLLDGARVEEVPITDWVLHQVDEQGRPVAIIQGLHEVLLSLDPTGREMRPRPASGASASP